MKTDSLLLPLLLMVAFLFFFNGTSGNAVGRRSLIPGGWQPIKDVRDAHVKEIAQFAVTEHNKEAKTNLKFQKVIRGESQVVAGTNYRLILAAKDGRASSKYEAVVWEKPWESFRNLTSFKRV
ncbi:PREDICTED: cysteine proteinase inhibitor 1-like [Nelumbo nucifera]|uniref:Cystatin domain-containing protein n=2 Tax=Nelumbo nucifera TaxID=4432 RepID=A0A822XWU4_NELNU|nr:PREDICTED: cysteine proteinase inhibitor 1-like [Nelumbo nucifera]DAD23589.1 TPA_asm: hypothetical protein HUJ06_025052 [Nelumbo nucifera]